MKKKAAVRKPSAKQLAARKKFAAMAKARAKAARAAKRGKVGKGRNPARSPRQQRFFGAELSRKLRGARTKTGLSVRKLRELARRNPGGTLTLAQLADAIGTAQTGQSVAGKKPASKLKIPGVSNKSVAVSYQVAMAAGRDAGNRSAKKAGRSKWSKADYNVAARTTTRLLKNPRKRNGSGARKVESLYKTFRGKPGKKWTTVKKTARNTPRRLGEAGRLVEIKLYGKPHKYKFSRARLGFDKRGKLHITGARFSPQHKALNPGELGNLGPIDYVVYESSKPHIDGGRVTQYKHKFGEEGGTMPDLCIDREGYPHVVGGVYKIKSEGITD